MPSPPSGRASRRASATDLRSAANALSALELTASLDEWIAALPLPGEDIPRMLVESLEGMADALDQLDGQLSPPRSPR